MAFNKQSDFINALLTTALILVPGIATANVDCKGKAFHCVNSTHFKICVDFGGVSETVDDFLIPCPPSTACTDSNYYECEIPTTLAPLARQSDVTNELFETTIVTSPWELLDVNTSSPINNNEKSVEWLENSTIASPEIVSTAAGTETVEIVDYKVVNEVINEVTTESEYIIHKTTTSDSSESNNSKSTNSIPNSYMTSLAITDETHDLSGHNISANISSASVTIGNNSTTESKIWMDVFDTMTTSSNRKDDEDFKSTNLFNFVITDSLNENNLTASLTTENYSGTKSEISIGHKSFITASPDADKISTRLSFPLKSNDFRLNIAKEATKNYQVTEFDTSISMLEQIETTPKNIEGSDDFATTISLIPLKTDDLGLKSSLATETTEKSGTEHETFITNNRVNTHFTTTLLVPLMTESIQNTTNIDINLFVTSDSYSTSTEQYSTVSYKNSLTETATTTKEMFTNANVNSTGTENKTLITNNKVNPHFTTTTLSAPMITEGLVNTPNIEIYLSDTSDSYSTSSEQFSSVSDTNTPTETATITNELYTNASVTGTGTKNETLITNNEVNPHFTTPTLSAPMITESLINTQNIETNLSVTSDSSTSAEQYSTASDKNSPIETTKTTKDMYTNATVTGSGAENKTMIMNNNVNPHFTKTTLSAPMITEGLLNTSSIDIYLTVTSDYYSTSTEQYSTVRYNNSSTETTTTTNEIYTNANVNGTGTENKTLIINNKVNPHFTTTTLSAPMITEGLVNTTNIEIYLSDTSDSYSTSFEQFSSVSDTNTPTETATITNELYTNATVTGTGTKNETLITNNEVNPHFTTPTLSAPMITESLINTQNIETNLSVTSDSSTSAEQYSTASDKNSPIETTTTTKDMYTNATVTGSGAENKTMIMNNNVNPHFTKTTLSAPMITEGLLNTSNIDIYLTVTSDYYSTSTEQYSTVRYNNSTESATTTNEIYTNANVNGTGTENNTLIMNNKVNPHFTTTTLSAPMITEGLVNTPNIEIYLSDTSDSYSTSFEQFSTVSDTITPTETTNEPYTNATVTGIDTKNETLITNNEVNPHFTTTTLSAPMITESLINTQNIEINFTVSDSNSAGTEQYSTVRHNNSPIQTAASTNQMYTNDVTKTSDSRLDGYSLNENDMTINRIDEISFSSQIQMEFNSTTTENVVLSDTLQVYSINEQNNLSSPVGSVVSLNSENVTSSDLTKFTTVTDLDQTNTQANVLYTNAPIFNENIILDTDGTSTTKLDITIDEKNLMRKNIANSSTAINLTTRSVFSETNIPKNTLARDTNSRTPTTRTMSDTYTTVANKNFQVDEFSIYENDSSTIPVSDIPSTVGYDKELHSTTAAVNIVLNNTADTILTKERSDISPQKSESHAISDLINKEPLETTTLQPTLAIDLTVNYISYDVNFSTATVNGNKLHKNVANKISNNTKDFLRHENGTYENIIDKITTPLPHIADFKSTAKAAASFTGSINDTVEEMKMTGTSDLSPPVTTGSPSVSEIIETSLSSDITDSYYVVNTEPHIDVTKVKLPIFSTIHETMQNNPTTQNIVTETFDGTEDEHGSTRNFEIQQHEKNTSFDSVSSPSVFPHFSKYNDNSTKPFNNRLKGNDSDSNMMYGSSYPLNLSTSTSKSNTKYTAEHPINLTIIGNLTATSATQPRITLNDTVLNFSALEPIFNLTDGHYRMNEITPTEYQNRPSTVNNVYDNIMTTHSYIRDGTGESSNLTEGDILKTTLLNEKPSMNTLGTDLNPSALINDRYNSVSDDINSSTSAKNTVTENYSYNNNNLPDYVIDSSTPAISVIDSFDLNTVTSTLVTGISSFADIYLPSNITSMGFEYKYTTKENDFTLTNVPKDSSQIFVTNEKSVHAATIYRNVNSSTKSNTLKGTNVVELEQLVKEDTNKIFASHTTSDIGSLSTENTLSLTPTLSKNISRQHILSANINKDINAATEKITWDSTMSDGLQVQDKILKSVKSKHLQNTSIIINESPQYHKNNNTYNFTKQIKNSVVVNTNANLYNANVKNITERKQNQTLDPVSILNFNNLRINVENLIRYDQNSSKIVPNKTRISDNSSIHLVINADKKQSLSNPVQTNEDKRKIHFTKITPVKLNNLPSDYEIEKTDVKFNCGSRQRGKYSEKNDCQNFYICTGRDEPIIGKCPNNTVFSEILKQCTRNLSHCIRNNQFQCTSAGRFVDILSDKFYYICAKKVKRYIRFKFQCQKGYHLDQSKLKCILDTFNESLSLDTDMTNDNEETSKTDGEKSTIESRSKEEKDSKKQKKDFECKEEGKFLYPDDCRKYYQCSKTGESKFRRKIKKCDSDEVFDNEMSKCVDEESYEC